MPPNTHAGPRRREALSRQGEASAGGGQRQLPAQARIASSVKAARFTPAAQGCSAPKDPAGGSIAPCRPGRSSRLEARRWTPEPQTERRSRIPSVLLSGSVGVWRQDPPPPRQAFWDEAAGLLHAAFSTRLLAKANIAAPAPPPLVSIHLFQAGRGPVSRPTLAGCCRSFAGEEGQPALQGAAP